MKCEMTEPFGNEPPNSQWHNAYKLSPTKETLLIARRPQAFQATISYSKENCHGSTEAMHIGDSRRGRRIYPMYIKR